MSSTPSFNKRTKSYGQYSHGDSAGSQSAISGSHVAGIPKTTPSPEAISPKTEGATIIKGDVKVRDMAKAQVSRSKYLTNPEI